MENKNNSLMINVGLVLLGLLIGWLIWGGWGMMRWGGNMMGNGYNNMMGQGNSIDQHFIEQMIPHHDGAIAMAELALTKSKRPEILSLANGIIEAQKREISDMTSWYESWFNIQVPVTNGHMMNGGGMMSGSNAMHMDGMSGDMERLSNATDFDLEFIRQMIPHHEMAVMMAQMLASTTTRSEMKILADQIITSQSKEIEMMRSWASAWVK
jgi:uncharacterized protein (DUF305 family)